MPDAVVIGSGHNGLVSACYLAAAGLDVVVVERDTVLGGAVSTVERFPGYLIDRGSSAHIMIRHTGIPEELRLDRHGLHYQDLDPWGFAPFWTAAGEQVALTFHADIDRTCASIESVCGARDADAYGAFARDWAGRNELVFEAFQHAPSPARVGRALWGLGRRTGLSGVELSRQFLTSGDALLDAHFTDERLKAALSWLGAQAGPPTHHPATADLVGWAAMLHRCPPGYPRGGSGRLTQALAGRLRADGGTLRLGDGARALLVRDGAVTGVRTDSGDLLAAPIVVAGCHLLTTMALLGVAAPAGLTERVRRHVRVGNGMGLAVRLGTTDLPRYPAANGSSHRALQLLVPDRSVLRSAHADFLAGRTPERPAVLAMTMSALDDTIAPPGRHAVTLWGQWHPYQLGSGQRWSEIASREADRCIAEVEAAAPGFAGGIEHVHVQAPPDLERELGLIRGDVMHLEMTLDQMFSWRPLPELSSYRVPGVTGLYLTGASTHPGGGVSGASGRTVARLILSERTRASSRRRLTAGAKVPAAALRRAARRARRHTEDR